MSNAGFESNGSKCVVKVWKNDVEQNLSDGTNRTEADCVFALGGDVYVDGQGSSYAVIRKNVLLKNYQMVQVVLL